MPNPTDELAAVFRALGDPTRLRIFQTLRECCAPVAVDDSGQARLAEGPTVGEVCCRVTGEDRVTSTISHHLRELRLAGLVVTERRGKHILCRVDEAAVRRIADYLRPDAVDSCCAGDVEADQEKN